MCFLFLFILVNFLTKKPKEEDIFFEDIFSFVYLFSSTYGFKNLFEKNNESSSFGRGKAENFRIQKLEDDENSAMIFSTKFTNSQKTFW